jgi:hypothetical protein
MSVQRIVLVLAGFALGLATAVGYLRLGRGEAADVPLAHLPAGVADSLAPDSLAAPGAPAVDSLPADSLPAPVAAVAALPAPDPVPVDTLGALPAEAAPGPWVAPDTAAQGRLGRVFGAMKPEEAARVLEQMEDGEARRLLARMPERKAGQILGRMSPQRAAALSRAVLNDTRGKL